MGDPFDGNSISPGVRTEDDDISLDDLYRKMQSKKSTLEQEYADSLKEANSIDNKLTPSQAFASTAIAFLPILGGMAFGGKDRNAIVADAAKVGSVTSSSYLGSLEKERKAESAVAAAQAVRKKGELDTLSKLEAMLPIEQIRQEGLNERSRLMRENVGLARSQVPASQLAEPTMARRTEKLLGLQPGSIVTTQQQRAGLEQYRMSGMARFPQGEGITPVEGAILKDDEANNLANARLALKAAARDIPKVISILDNRGRYELTAIQRDPKKAEELGRDIQTIRTTFLSILAAEKEGNPIFKGILTDQDLNLLKTVVPDLTTTDPIQGFLGWVSRATDVEKGRLKEVLAKTQRSYALAARGRINDPFASQDLFAPQRQQLSPEIQQLMAQQQQDSAQLAELKAMLASPTPTPTPMR